MTTLIKDIIKDLNVAANMASLQTIVKANSANDNVVVRYEDYEDHIQDVIGQIVDDIQSRHHVQKKLKHMANMFLIDVPMEARPSLFRQLNSLLATLMTIYLDDKGVYKSCYNVSTAFKNQLDQREQEDDTLNEVEWEELQKSVYLMTDWEDQFIISQKRPSEAPVLTLKRF